MGRALGVAVAAVQILACSLSVEVDKLGGNCTDTNTLTDCGACGLPCAPANALEPSCAAGACAYRACVEGFHDCDGDTANGCETPKIDVSHCGSCGNACTAPPGADPLCDGSSCSWQCRSPLFDCDRDDSNGCEVDLSSDPLRCGSCSTACTLANAAPSCVNGMCSTAACTRGWADCNGVVADGCERNTDSDVLHCGMCDLACPALANSAPTCTAGVCGFVCVAGYLDCSAGAGCETHSDVDGLNCGACGHSCLGGSCQAGECPTTPLFPGNDIAYGIVLDASSVYFTVTFPGLIGRVAKDGSNPTVLDPSEIKPFEIAADGTNLYWTSSDLAGAVRKMPKTGGAATTLATATPQLAPYAIAVDGFEVFWSEATTSSATSRVRSIDVNGLQAPTTLAFGEWFPSSLALDSTDVYWACTNNGTTVKRVSKTGGVAIELANGQSSPYGVAVTGGFVYWTNLNGGSVMKVAAGGGTAQQIAAVQSPRAITADATHVYFTDTGGMVYKVANTGGPTLVLASVTMASGTIAVDATHVYFPGDGNSGAVFKVPK